MKALGLFPVLLAAVALVPGAAASPSGLPQQAGSVDLSTQANLEVPGAAAGDGAGAAVASIGDMNGDGRNDVLVGASYSDNGQALSDTGSAYVVFGREAPGRLSLWSVSAGLEAGIRINGANVGDQAGQSVAGAGDVNGDGRPDVVIGAPWASNNTRRFSGSVYVVFGRRESGTINLGSLGTGGFRIDGAGDYHRAGDAVSGVGDVNGDGRADVLLGAPGADANAKPYSGSAYVVFGSASTATVDLAALGDRGFRIDGGTDFDFLGESVAGPGDVNGDARADVLVGASSADAPGRYGAGAAYLVYGAASTTTVDVGSLGGRGVQITGAAAYDNAGVSVAGAGDLDGDGEADLLVGAAWADADGRFGSGSAYVVLGKALGGNVDLAALGDGGLRIDGAVSWENAGTSVAAVGDVNGDTRPDIAVGAPYALYNGRRNSGSAYVVYGPFSAGSLDLGSLGDRGFRVDGAGADDFTGSAVAGPGDVNGDGRSDVLVGVPGLDPLDLANAGGAFAVYGFGTPELAYDAVSAAAGRPLAPHGPRLVRRTGPAGFTVSPALPEGLRLDPETGVLSGTPRARPGTAAYEVTMTDLAGSATAPLVLTLTPDRTPPRLKLGARSPQRPLRRGAIVVLASCDESCTLVASGRIHVAGRGQAIRLRDARTALAGAWKSALRLSLPAPLRSPLAEAFGAGRSARATVTVRARDRAGNVTVGRRTIMLRP